MANTRLGANITAEAINNFFSLKPNAAPKTNFAVHRAGARDHVQKMGKLAEERRSSGSENVYSILTEPSHLKSHSEEDKLVSDAILEADPAGLNQLEDVIPEHKGPDHPALDVYDNYKFDHEYDPELPITEHREWVIGTIEMNEVTIIQGATGSGKTTQVPQYILDYYRDKRQYCNILVTQPRRIAAESIAKRVSEERGWPCGHLVGFQVGRNRKVSEDTRITYVTTGVLLQKMIQKKNMNEYTHIILDEVHERDQDIDLAMLVAKKFLNTVSKHVKIVLMSATMDCSLFSRYFSVIVGGKLEGAPVVSVEGRMFDVGEYYLDHLRSLGEIPFQNIAEPEISELTYKMAKTLIMEFDKSETESQGIGAGTKFAPKRGTVLVFLPGYQEIDSLHKHLEKIEIERNLQVLILHSQITSIDQSKIFMKAQAGKRKVILSTNIAESSITVPDIKYVIDFCLIKNLETDGDTNYQSLRLGWASKSSMNQRKGRAGRVSDGECFRLITHDFYQRLPDYGVPEMQRCPLYQVVLSIKMLDIGNPCTLLKMALQPPEVNDIRRTILLLKEIGALTLKQNGKINPLDGDLTFVGKVLGSLPVDIRIGKLLILGHVFGCLNECLIIAAALSLKSCFAMPFKKDFQSYSYKMQWANWSFSDCIAVLHCYREKLFPVITLYWKQYQTKMLDLLKESTEKLVICGDGRHDSMGHCAKYGAYSLMCTNNQQLIHFELVQEWKHKRENVGFGREGESAWGRKNFVETKVMHEVDHLIKELEDRLKHHNIRRNYDGPVHARRVISPNDMLILKVAICGAFYPFYFISGEIDDAEGMKTLSGHDPFSTVMLHNVPGVLYKEKIASMLRPCGKGKYLHFPVHTSRCYVEFDRSQTQNPPQHPVLPAVYLAVKMRQLRMGLHLFVQKERDDNFMRRLESLQMSDSTNSSLRSSSLTTSLQRDDGGDEPVDSHVVSLPSSGYIEVYVTVALEAGHFWAHLGNVETFKKIGELQQEINAMGGKNLSRVSNGIKLKQGDIVLGWFEDEFYRARVEEEIRQQNQNFVKVFFLDYGNQEVLPRDQIRRCPDHFLQLPHQAFECYLCEIRPIFGQWTEAANDRFHGLTQNQKLLGKIYCKEENRLRLDLYFPDNESNVDNNHINKILIDEGFAEQCEESYHSKMARQDSERHKKMINESKTLLTKLHDSSEIHEIQEYETTKINLRGPFSPFETSFYSLTSNGRFRTTYIERYSVNSVFICEEPQEKHPRFMVSSNVGVNATGNTLIARDTTVMPNIHGIASIIPILFAPFAEYRINKERSKIIGAICGLGFIESSNSPILPEHDMEVIFDVEFTKADVQMVNSVRKGINYAFKNEETWGTSAVEKIQNFTKKNILQLLYRQRDSVERTEFSRPYQWNQIPEIARLEPANEDGSTVPLYALHCGVWIEDPKEIQESAIKERKQRQVRDLYGMAGRSTDAFPQAVVCPLCSVECRHPHALNLHLKSRYHMHEERLLFPSPESQNR